MFPLIGIFNRLYFNPRSHERSDPIKINADSRHDIISIHAPTRGATFSLNEVLRCPDISIHAPTRGATVPASASHSSVVFQSTLPREERPGSFPAAVGLMLHFNPRSHERSDEELTALMNTVNISIHAPTRGATDSRLDNVEEYQYISIHAPTRGATDELGNPVEDVDISIHAPTRGATIPGVIDFPDVIQFQSTLPREERRINLFCGLGA